MTGSSPSSVAGVSSRHVPAGFLPLSSMPTMTCTSRALAQSWAVAADGYTRRHDDPLRVPGRGGASEPVPDPLRRSRSACEGRLRQATARFAERLGLTSTVMASDAGNDGGPPGSDLPGATEPGARHRPSEPPGNEYPRIASLSPRTQSKTDA